MDILRKLSLASASASVPRQIGRVGTVLTIGKFDGVHRGHRTVLERVAANAARLGALATVMTFDPHPRDYFRHLQTFTCTRRMPSPRVTSLRDTLQQIETCGVDRVVFQRFDAAFAGLTADAFVRRVLVGQLDVKSVLVGEDFRFGRDRTGDLAFLMRAGKEYGFEVETISAVLHDGARISSSAVRAALADADIGSANALLGRPYAVSGWLSPWSEERHVHRVSPERGFRLEFGAHPLPLPAGVYEICVHGLYNASLHMHVELGAGQVATSGGESYRSLLPLQRRAFPHAPLRVMVEFLTRLSPPESRHESSRTELAATVQRLVRTPPLTLSTPFRVHHEPHDLPARAATACYTVRR